jgi:hypothetical protein
MQKGFIDFVVGPFIADLGRLLPGLQSLGGLLAANRASWEENDDLELLATVDALRTARAVAAEQVASERAMAAAAAAADAVSLDVGQGSLGGSDCGERRRSSASDSASGDDGGGVSWLCI